jgi:uncharacterized protein with FMN-binding domain
MSTRTTRRRLAGLAGLLAAVTLPVAVKAATAPASRPVALDPGRPARPAPSASAAAAPHAGGASRTVTGTVEDTPYGPVQVSVTLTGARIVDVAPVQLPNDNGRSREINNYAAPLLRQEVLTAQSAQVDTISGASYTSDGYARSVQAALDAAGPGR